MESGTGDENMTNFLMIGVTIWVAIYALSYYKSGRNNPDHFNNHTVSHFHCFVGITLAFLDIYFNDDAIFSTTTLIAWDTGWFVVDLIDCFVRGDAMFFAHAIVGFFLLRTCSLSPFYELKAASKGYVVELNVPFMNRWKTTKTKADFRNFMAATFLFRIVYTPIFLNGINTDGNGAIVNNKFAILSSAAFYLMNVIWFYKGVIMYVNYDEQKATSKAEIRKKQQ